MTEIIAHRFPWRTLVEMRPDVADVEKNNFSDWARRFVEEVSDLSAEGRKVLLVYDVYRSHMD